MRTDKIVFYLPEHQVIEDCIRGKIQLSRTKNEDILYPLRNRESLTYRLLETIARDSILRQLFFAKSNLTYSFNPTYPTEIVFPIFLKSQDNFVEEVERGRLHDYVEQMRQELKRVESEVEELTFSFFSDFAIVLLSNPAFLQKIKRRKIPKENEFQQVLTDIVNRHKDQLKEIITKNLDALGKVIHAMELSQVMKAIDDIRVAQENYKVLSFAITLPDEIEYFKDALTKLTSSGASVVSIRSICLDCKLRYDRDSVYTLSERNVRRLVNLRTECPNCGGSAVIHYITISGGEGLKGLMLTHKLQEAIIAFSLSKLSEIRKVYVSKKVSAIIDGNVQKGLEIDITAITEDNKLILVEVSTTPRESNAVNNASRKLNNISERKIPFDKYIYISPTPLDDFIRLGSRDAYVLPASYLPHLENFIRDHVLD